MQRHHHRAHDRDNHAVKVQTCDPRSSEEVEQKSTRKSTYNSKRNVEPKALALYNAVTGGRRV